MGLFGGSSRRGRSGQDRDREGNVEDNQQGIQLQEEIPLGEIEEDRGEQRSVEADHLPNGEHQTKPPNGAAPVIQITEQERGEGTVVDLTEPLD